MKVKKGKKEYSLLPGDRLLDNGACLMFVPKDNKELPMAGWYRAEAIRISKKEFNRIITEYPNIKIMGRDLGYLIYYKILQPSPNQ